jgi:hypothetical protein
MRPGLVRHIREELLAWCARTPAEPGINHIHSAMEPPRAAIDMPHAIDPLAAPIERYPDRPFFRHRADLLFIRSRTPLCELFDSVAPVHSRAPLASTAGLLHRQMTPFLFSKEET